MLLDRESAPFQSRMDLSTSLRALASEAGQLYMRTSKLVAGVFGAQLLGAATLPILSRIYSPEQFGVFAIFFLAVQFLGINAAWRYEQGILVAESNREVEVLSHLSIVLAIATTALVGIALSVHTAALDRAFSTNLGALWVLIAPVGLVASVATTCSTIALRVERYLLVSVSRVTKVLTVFLAQIGGALLTAPTTLLLLLGELLGNLASVAVFSKKLDPSVKAPSTDEFRSAAIKHRDLPTANLPQSLVNSSVPWLLMSLAALAFSSAETGQFFLMFRIVLLPAALLGSTLSQVYLRRAHEERGGGKKFSSTFANVAAIQTCLGALLGTSLYLAGPYLFPLVLGEQWGLAGQLASAFAPYVAFHFALASLAPTAIVANRQRWAATFAIGKDLALVGSFAYCAWQTGDVLHATKMSALFTLPFMTVQFLWYRHLAGTTA